MGDGSVSINMGQPQWPPMAIEESFKGKQWKVNVLYWESQSTIFLSGFPCFKNGQSRQNGRGTVVVGVAATCKSSEVPPESWAGGDLLVIRALNLLESGSTFLTFPICEVILWLTPQIPFPCTELWPFAWLGIRRCWESQWAHKMWSWTTSSDTAWVPSSRFSNRCVVSDHIWSALRWWATGLPP